MSYQSGYDIYAHYGRHLIDQHVIALQTKLNETRSPNEQIHLPRDGTPLPPSLVAGDAHIPEMTVGILGAGVGGLYAALILESLGIKYEILEASKRVGGRLYTHHFSQEKYDYYDVGAMRFPRNIVMTRASFDLTFSKDDKAKSLLYYNDVRKTRGSDPSGDDFQWSRLDVSEDYLKVGVTPIVNDVVGPFVDKLMKDLDPVNGTHKGWDYLMQFDAYSTRAYMGTKYIPSPSLDLPQRPLPTETVNWCETFDNSTGSYDRSLAETVLEDMAFNLPGDWFLIDGGASQLTQVMASYLDVQNKGQIVFSSRVTGIAGTKTSITVSVHGQPDKTYPHVISTLPLPCLRAMDLSKASLTHKQANALRQLTYGPSIKVGIKFKSHWWSTASDKDGNPLDIIGGQSYTDRPVRAIVYPSYGLAEKTPSNVLIASYCWTDDAERLSALMHTGQETHDLQLKELVLRDLAVVHNLDMQFLLDEFEEMYPWSWGHDPLTMGAFAFFGPGMFSTAYKALTVPACHGRLHFGGEALSVRHAWVVGALDSAWRSVKELVILVYGVDSDQYRKFTDTWGHNEEWTRRAPLNREPMFPVGEELELKQDLLLDHLRLDAPHLFESSVMINLER